MLKIFVLWAIMQKVKKILKICLGHVERAVADCTTISITMHIFIIPDSQ